MLRQSISGKVSVARAILLMLAIGALGTTRGRLEAKDTAAVQQASFERSQPASKPQSVRFGRRAPQVGDQMEQTVSVTLKLDSLARQQSQIVERAKTAVHRSQRRLMTSTDVADGMTTAAMVRYLSATMQSAAGEREADLTAVPTSRQPVHEKKYRCRRIGEKLEIVDDDGHIPPLDEYEIVAQNMEALGGANPLAEFLCGQTVSVGQQLALPNDVADKLLGLGDEVGKAMRFDLTLRDVRPIDGAMCAVFDAGIEAASSRSSQMRLALDGPLAVQVDTCRAVEANFVGPIGMSETRGSLSETYQISATGRMTIAIKTEYRDAP